MLQLLRIGLLLYTGWSVGIILILLAIFVSESRRSRLSRNDIQSS